MVALTSTSLLTLFWFHTLIHILFYFYFFYVLFLFYFIFHYPSKTWQEPRLTYHWGSSCSSSYCYSPQSFDYYGEKGKIEKKRKKRKKDTYTYTYTQTQTDRERNWSNFGLAQHFLNLPATRKRLASSFVASSPFSSFVGRPSLGRRDR